MELADIRKKNALCVVYQIKVHTFHMQANHNIPKIVKYWYSKLLEMTNENKFQIPINLTKKKVHENVFWILY